MQPRLSLLTLGVADLDRATDFYADVLGLPRLPSPPSIVFFELRKTWLALYPREALAADAGVEADPAPRFPGFCLAHNVASEAEVDALVAEVEAGGGRIVKPPPARRLGWGLGVFR